MLKTGTASAHLLVRILLVTAFLSGSAYTEDHSTRQNRTNSEHMTAEQTENNGLKYGQTASLRKWQDGRNDPGALIELLVVERVSRKLVVPPTPEQLKLESGPSISNPQGPRSVGPISEAYHNLLAGSDLRKAVNKSVNFSGHLMPQNGRDTLDLAADVAGQFGPVGTDIGKKLRLGEKAADYIFSRVHDMDMDLADGNLANAFPDAVGEAKNAGLSLANLKTFDSAFAHQQIATALQNLRNSPLWVEYLEQRGVLPPGFLKMNTDELERAWPGSTTVERIHQIEQDLRGLSAQEIRRHENVMGRLESLAVSSRRFQQSEANIGKLKEDAEKDSNIKRQILLHSVNDPNLLAKLGGLSTDEYKEITERIQSKLARESTQQNYEMAMAAFGILETLAAGNRDARIALTIGKAVTMFAFAASLSDPLMALASMDGLLKALIGMPDVSEKILKEVQEMRVEMAQLKRDMHGRFDMAQKELARLADRTQVQLFALEARLLNGQVRLRQQVGQAITAAEKAYEEAVRNRKKAEALQKETQDKETEKNGLNLTDIVQASALGRDTRIATFKNNFGISANALYVNAHAKGASDLSASGPVEESNRSHTLNIEAAKTNFASRPNETRSQRYYSHFKILPELQEKTPPLGANLDHWAANVVPFTNILSSRTHLDGLSRDAITDVYCAWDSDLKKMQKMTDTASLELKSRRDFLPTVAVTGERSLLPLLGHLKNYEDAVADLVEVAKKERDDLPPKKWSAG
jgi:hypothetical protein